jgi:hypothetical protein
MDDIKLPDGSAASEGVKPEERRRVGPESEVRGGPEAPREDGGKGVGKGGEAC